MLNRLHLKAEEVRNHRFHSHQARIYEYQYSDGVKKLEFWSYSTPIIVKIGSEMYLNKEWYSMTTTRQTNRFCNEYGINKSDCRLLDEYEIRRICN